MKHTTYYGDKTMSDITMFHTYEYDGEAFDHQFVTKQFARQAADRWWIDKCEEECEWAVYGEAFEDIVYIVSFYYHPETGERVINEREAYNVLYEQQPSQMQQHSVWHPGAGGVL